MLIPVYTAVSPAVIRHIRPFQPCVQIFRVDTVPITVMYYTVLYCITPVVYTLLSTLCIGRDGNGFYPDDHGNIVDCDADSCAGGNCDHYACNETGLCHGMGYLHLAYPCGSRASVTWALEANCHIFLRCGEYGDMSWNSSSSQF